MSTPTLRELCANATPGPWTAEHGRNASGEWWTLYTAKGLPEQKVFGGYRPIACKLRMQPEDEANVLLIARCEPPTMLKVYEALESLLKEAHAMSLGLAARGVDDDSEGIISAVAAMDNAREALAILDGKAP